MTSYLYPTWGGHSHWSNLPYSSREAYLRWRSVPLSTMYPPTTFESSAGDSSFESPAGINAGIGMEVDVGVDVDDEVEDEVESSDRGTIEVEVDMVVGIDIHD
nr:hypothetical protein [Tanacetum cinerariifolium]